MRKLQVIITIMAILATPAYVHANQSIKHAQVDANQDIGFEWIAYGACFPIISTLYASLEEPSVPEYRLKKASRNRTYLRAYKRAARKKMIDLSIMGLLIGGIKFMSGALLLRILTE